MVLATPIVRVIFEHGRFTASDTVATAVAVQLYAIGLIGYSVVRIASPTFYALGKNRIPVIVSMFTVAVNAALNIKLVEVMGYAGLALGTSIAAIFNATVLLILLHRQLGGLNEGHIFASLSRISAASAAMALAAFFADRWFETVLPGSALPLQILRVSGAIAAALAVLALSAWALKIREFDDGLNLVLRRFRRMRQ
jgi:putative peptidoglycan lipid II flippase